MSKVTFNMKGIDELKKTLADADKKTAQIGWFPSAAYDDGTPVASVAAMQELGTKTAPPRPYFRPTISEKKEDWAALVDSGLNAMVNGKATIDQVLNGLSLAVVGDVKESISGPHLALSPVTLALRRLRNEGATVGAGLVGAVAGAIARGETGAGQLGQPYGNATPLNDTGYMIATLTHEVS